jgi:hypothetical protein
MGGFFVAGGLFPSNVRAVDKAAMSPSCGEYNLPTTPRAVRAYS